jgi:hypothetical protein
VTTAWLLVWTPWCLLLWSELAVQFWLFSRRA